MSRRPGPAPAGPVAASPSPLSRFEEVVRVGHLARQQQDSARRAQPVASPVITAPTIVPQPVPTGGLFDFFRSESVKPFLTALEKFNNSGDTYKFGAYGLEALRHRLPKDEGQARRALQSWYHICVEASPVAATLKIAKELVAELHATVPLRFEKEWVTDPKKAHIMTINVCQMLIDLRAQYNDGDTYSLLIPHLRTVYINDAVIPVLYGLMAAVDPTGLHAKRKQKMQENIWTGTFSLGNMDSLRTELETIGKSITTMPVYNIMMKHARAIVDAWVPAFDWEVEYSRDRAMDDHGWQDACPVYPNDADQRRLIDKLGELFVVYYNTSAKMCKPRKKRADEEQEPRTVYANKVTWDQKYAAAEEGQATLVCTPPKTSLLEQGGTEWGCDPLADSEDAELRG